MNVVSVKRLMLIQLHIEVPGQESNQGPSCSEAAALTTAWKLDIQTQKVEIAD